MALSVKTMKPTHRKPELIDRLEGHDSRVNAAVLIPKEDGVISVSDDRTIRVWLRRDSGQYWPSVCHQVAGDACALHYESSSRRFFVGLSTGFIQEFQLSDDFNKITHRRDYNAHSSCLTDVKFSLTCEWVLSTAKDKYLQWHCSETGGRLGAYKIESQCLCLEFDEASLMTFVGDLSGNITVLKLENTTCTYVSTLKGHMGSIQDLAWDVERSLLFSASFDNSVICWDIGGQKGVAYELNGHHEKVQALCYLTSSRMLFSAASDTSLVLWDINVKRTETPKWVSSDSCMICGKPFFWNVKQMWQEKKLGYRQHHCRKCGAAVCDECSNNKSIYPPMGYEYPVRMCNECKESIMSDEMAPNASTFDAKHKVTFMNADEQRKKLLTVGTDLIIKIWDISSLI